MYVCLLLVVNCGPQIWKISEIKIHKFFIVCFSELCDRVSHCPASSCPDPPTVDVVLSEG